VYIPAGLVLTITCHKASPSEFILKYAFGVLQVAPAVAIATNLILYTKVRLWCPEEAFINSPKASINSNLFKSDGLI